jgi:hypothetical protein
MTHGPTRIPSRNICIYCDSRNVELTEEHVVPLSLGGAHILERASCRDCAKITSRFEDDVARRMWGDARISYNIRTRHKKRRPTHITLPDTQRPDRQVTVPYSEYPAPMLFYKMASAGFLLGLSSVIDVSGQWQMVTVQNSQKTNDFERKFGIKMTAKFTHVPDSFGRLLIKIGYCNILCSLDPSDFRALCVPYILGKKSNPSFLVGSATEIAPPEPFGYRLSNFGFGDHQRMFLGVEVRLFANAETPTYHVIVGDVIGPHAVSYALAKLGEISILTLDNLNISIKSDDAHWMPKTWPLTTLDS